MNNYDSSTISHYGLQFGDLFQKLKWKDILQNNEQIIQDKNEEQIINYYSHIIKKECEKIENSSLSSSTLVSIKNLFNIMNESPQEVKNIFNAVTIECMKNEWQGYYNKEVCNDQINNLYHKTLNNTDSVLSFSDCSLAEKEAEEEQTLFFIFKEYPKISLLLREKIEVMRKIYEKVSNEVFIIFLNHLNRFFEKNEKEFEKFIQLLDSPTNQQRLIQILKHERLKEYFSFIFKEWARVSTLLTHEWKKELPKTNPSFMETIKEVSIIQRMIFTGTYGVCWPKAEFASSIKEENEYTGIADREASLFINSKYLRELREVGGYELFLKTSDGDRIHTMQLSAKKFSEAIQVVLSELEKVDEWEEKKSGQKIKVYAYPKEEIPLDHTEIFLSLRILSKKNKETLIEELKKREIDIGSKLLESKKEEFLILYAPLVDSLAGKEESTKTLKKNPTTAIICPGNMVWFSVYKSMIARLLLNGINVTAFSYRGYEYSEGRPTDKKVTEDLETVCHFLKEEQEISDEDILLYASCMGLGPASMYLSTHPHTDLFIDRSFSKLSTLSQEKLQSEPIIPTQIPFIGYLAGWVSRVAMPWFVNFENISHLKKAKGNIALVTAEQDEVIPKTEAEKLKQSLPLAEHITSPAQYKHSGNWIGDPNMIIAFEKFLLDKGHARPFEKL